MSDSGNLSHTPTVGCKGGWRGTSWSTLWGDGIHEMGNSPNRERYSVTNGQHTVQDELDIMISFHRWENWVPVSSYATFSDVLAMPLLPFWLGDLKRSGNLPQKRALSFVLSLPYHIGMCYGNCCWTFIWSKRMHNTFLLQILVKRGVWANARLVWGKRGFIMEKFSQGTSSSTEDFLASSGNSTIRVLTSLSLQLNFSDFFKQKLVI